MYETIILWGAPYIAFSIITGTAIYGLDKQISGDVTKHFFYWQCFLLGFLWPVGLILIPFIPFIAFFVSLRSYLLYQRQQRAADKDRECSDA